VPSPCSEPCCDEPQSLQQANAAPQTRTGVPRATRAPDWEGLLAAAAGVFGARLRRARSVPQPAVRTALAALARAPRALRPLAAVLAAATATDAALAADAARAVLAAPAAPAALPLRVATRALLAHAADADGPWAGGGVALEIWAYYAAVWTVGPLSSPAPKGFAGSLQPQRCVAILEMVLLALHCKRKLNGYNLA
jgi:hypothetical protein